MKKRFFVLCAALLAAAGCSDDTATYYIDELFVDTVHCQAEGSYVQGIEVGPLCRVRIPYEHARGGVARISAPTTNGLRIDPQETVLAEGSGEATVGVQGMPLVLETSFLQLNIEYRGRTYLSSVEITVLEDVDPTGSISFELDDTPLTGLTEPRTIPFTVDPTMAAVVASGPAVEGLRVAIASDPETGLGSITLTPSAQFLDGEVELTATFGAREPQVRTLRVSAFAEGAGTDEAPYVVASAAELQKLAYGTDRAFSLGTDLTLDNGWSPIGSAERPFTGTLDGNGKRITLALDRPQQDRVALFAYVGAGAAVRNLTLDGSVTGREYVAALAAESAEALTADVSAVAVQGENRIAAAVASGAGRDARVIEFDQVPTAVNIPMGSSSATESLGLVTRGATVAFDPGTTGTTWSYDDATGRFTVTKGADFAAGNATFRVLLGERVRSTERTLAVTSKNMYESGTGTASDPYVVADADQFAATLHTYPAAHTRLDADVALGSWETLDSFSGSLDGAGHTVSGLTAQLIGTLTGSVSDIRFTGVDIETSTGFGTIARTAQNTARIEKVAVAGRIVSTHTGDILGGIAGELTGSGQIVNCYVDLDITASCGMVGGIVGRMKSTAGVTIAHCTSEGSIVITASKTRIGGIVGRGEDSGTNVIRNCRSSMALSATNANANSFGGIFGANNNDAMKIEECLFSGSVHAAFDVGGIAGVGPNIKNCLVVGAVLENTSVSSSTGHVGGLASISKKYADLSIVRNTSITGVTNNNANKPAAGAVCTYQNNGKTRQCVVLATTIRGSTTSRISGQPLASDPLVDNYAASDVVLQDGAGTPAAPEHVGADQPDGADTPAVLDRAWFESLGYDFTDVWMWDDAAGAPMLQRAGCDAEVAIH